jgi:hypothetical protein
LITVALFCPYSAQVSSSVFQSNRVANPFRFGFSFRCKERVCIFISVSSNFFTFLINQMTYSKQNEMKAKQKLFFKLILSCAFVTLGLWLINKANIHGSQENTINPKFLYVTGIFVIVIFGFYIIYILRQIFFKRKLSQK